MFSLKMSFQVVLFQNSYTLFTCCTYVAAFILNKTPLLCSHKTHTFNNYYVTAQHCSMLQALSLNFFNNKTHSTGKSYSHDHSAQTQHTEQTDSLIRN